MCLPRKFKCNCVDSVVSLMRWLIYYHMDMSFNVQYKTNLFILTWNYFFLLKWKYIYMRWGVGAGKSANSEVLWAHTETTVSSFFTFFFSRPAQELFPLQPNTLQISPVMDDPTCISRFALCASLNPLNCCTFTDLECINSICIILWKLLWIQDELYCLHRNYLYIVLLHRTI